MTLNFDIRDQLRVARETRPEAPNIAELVAMNTMAEVLFEVIWSGRGDVQELRAKVKEWLEINKERVTDLEKKGR